MNEAQIIKALQKYASTERAEMNARFFKTGKGEYGEGDIFLGVTVPDTKKVVAEIKDRATLSDAEKLLTSLYHEVRLVGTLLFVYFYQKAARAHDEKERVCVAETYRKNGSKYNNWDLVDTSASQVCGDHLMRIKDAAKKKEILGALMQSHNLWENRIAVVSMYAFIKQKDHALPFFVIEKSLFHTHDLMHKANGWMLREIGKHSGKEVLDQFLHRYAATMPRTTLRYALEKHESTEREVFMSMKKKMETKPGK